MNILVISASMRKESQSLKVSKYLSQRVHALEDESEVIDLHALKLPMYDDGETKSSSEATLIASLKNADGVVFVSPEWNGMMSHGLVNMMHYVGSTLAHKPVMLVGVSSGRGGTYPLAQMRLMGYKNSHFVISPENLIVNGVKDSFNKQDQDDTQPDVYIKKRADYALGVLIEYSNALKSVRSSDVVDMSLYPNGM